MHRKNCLLIRLVQNLFSFFTSLFYVIYKRLTIALGSLILHHKANIVNTFLLQIYYKNYIKILRHVNINKCYYLIMEYNFYSPMGGGAYNTPNQYQVTQNDVDLFYGNTLIGKTVDYTNALEKKLEENTEKAREYKELLIQHGIIERELTADEKQEKRFTDFEQKQAKEIQELKQMIISLGGTHGHYAISTDTSDNQAKQRDLQQVRSSRGIESSDGANWSESGSSVEHDR